MRYVAFSKKRVCRPSRGGVAIISTMKDHSWRYKSRVTSMKRHDSGVIRDTNMAFNFLIKLVICLATPPVTIQPEWLGDSEEWIRKDREGHDRGLI
jgi:hypothetical protein